MTPEILAFCLELWRADTRAAPTLPATVAGFTLWENGAITGRGLAKCPPAFAPQSLWSRVYSERATLARGSMTPEIRARIAELTRELRALS